MGARVLPLIGFLFTFSLVAQENVFLQRDFWKGNPSIAEVEAAITAGNDVAELNENMFDAVSYAFIERVDNATIKHLLGKKGNAVDKITHDGRTYIFWAAYRDNLEMMQWLVDRGAKANIEDAHGYTVLNFAAVTGQTNPKLYDFLLKHQANINATNHSGANALLLVSSFAKNFDILNYFVEKGLSLDSVDEQGNGIFQYAAKGGHIPLLKTLIAKGADYKITNTKGENALFMAAQGTRGQQHGKAVFEYLEGLSLKTGLVNEEGKNLLHLISGRNTNEDLFHYLIAKGLDVNLQDGEGTTPLMNASRGNGLEVVKLLGEYVEDIDVQDKKGRSALALAVSRNRPEVVKFLLEQEADFSVNDKSGNTLAYYLIQTYKAGNPKDFETKWELLEAAGLGLNDLQHDGNTLLHLAAKANNLPLLKRLEEFDMDINKKNDEGNTALHLAAMSTGNTEILKYLIDQGADVGLKTDFEETVYDLARENELLQQQEEQLNFLKL